MNITEQNILVIDPHTTDLQTSRCGHQIREVKDIKKTLSEDCILCFGPLIGNRKLCIYNCGHIMHIDCHINNQKIDASKDKCLACIKEITSMAIYENSKNLEEYELYSCIDDKCNELRKQERMVPFFLIKDSFTPQNQAIQDQTVQKQNRLFEIYQNIAPTLNDDEKVMLLKIVTSSNITADEKQQQIIIFLTDIGIPFDFNSILIDDNSLPEDSSVIPDVNINTSRSSSNTIKDNTGTIATTSASTSSPCTSKQPETRATQNQNINSSTTERRLSFDDTSESSETPMIRARRQPFFRRVKNILLCKK